MSEQEQTVPSKKAKGEAEVTAPKAHHNREKKNSRWTESLCQRYAKRFLTRDEWVGGHPSSYKAADANGWLEACTSHMTKVAQLQPNKKQAPVKATFKKSA